MKKHNFVKLFTIAFFQLWSFVTLAQSEVTIDDLTSITPPAFNIIDVEPKSITRPTTPRGLATDLVSSFNENGLKPNLSLEVAPFWLKKNVGITFQEYLNPSTYQSIRQSFSASIATKERKISADKTQGTQLGIGFRTQIIPGNASVKTQTLIKESYGMLFLSQIIGIARALDNPRNVPDLKVSVGKAIASIIANPRIQLDIPGKTKPEIITELSNAAFRTELINLIDANPINSSGTETIDNYILRLQSLTAASKIKELQESMKYKVGWILEISAASAIAFPTNSFSGVKHDKLGGWGTLTYRWDNQQDEFNLLARYARSFKDSVSTNTDIGIAYAHTSKNYSISVEGIYRFYRVEFIGKSSNNEDITILEKNDTYRVAVNGSYKLSDAVALTATFGRNYDNSFFTSGNLLALLGINLALQKNSLPIK